MIRTALIGLVLVLVVSVSRADVESGPKAGEKIAELKVTNVVGEFEGKEVDFAKERKDAPTVYIFVNADKFDRPMARLMKVLDGKIAGIDEKAHVVIVWIGGEEDAVKKRLPAINMSLKFEKSSMSMYTADKTGPNGWGLNTDAHLTVVVANKAKVAKSFAYSTVNETDEKAVSEALKKAVTK